MTSYRIKNIARINSRVLPEGTDEEFRFRYIDISAVDGLGNVLIPEEDVAFENAPSRARRLAPAGSVIVSTVRTYLKAIASVPEGDDPLVFSTGFAVLEAMAGVDSRYLAYHCRSSQFIDAVVARSVGVSYPAISPSEIGDLPISLPALEEQRRIAEFLDVETARIDRLVAKRSEMRDLLALRRERIVESELGIDQNARRYMTPLKYLAEKVTVGIVITPAKWYVESGGVPALRGLNVKPGLIDTENLVSISSEGNAENVKSRLVAGDVVIVRTGQAGAAAVVPEELDGANCIDLILVRPGRKLNSAYLQYALNSNWVRMQVAKNSVGSIQAHFNVGSMKQVSIPSIPLVEQEEIVAALDEKTGALDILEQKLNEQEKLLADRRQALITAAVTGQLDVTTARPAHDHGL
ncbi:restriction endonuclease subunit S [Streptomyces sp. NPDC001668]|uniref:restriction endonuclease subunit S n=1 Tax=Streptomyces sp. NPDC001668 TaxID=3364598 RepID=UPI0036A195B0